MLINTTTFSDLTDNLEIKWRKRYEAFNKVAAFLYDVEDVDVITSDESSFDGFSMARKKREGQDHELISTAQGYRKAWEVYEVSGMTKITWKMRKGARYRQINQGINNMADSTALRMEVDLTHRFGYAWATSYTDYDGDVVDVTVGDGLAMMSASHTLTESSKTYRNAIANNPPLSESAIQAGRKLFSTGMLDNNGEPIMVKPDSLIVSNDPTVIDIASKYLKSVGSVDDAHSGIYNPLQGRYRLVVLDYLSFDSSLTYDSTKAGYWFLASVKDTDAMLKILQRPQFIAPTMMDGKEFETMDWKYATHAAYAILILRTHWIVGSKGDSST